MTATKRRRLGDLYVLGKPLTLDDGNGPVDVWLQKINPVEHEDSLRRAGQARAVHLSYVRDKTSDMFISAAQDTRDFASHDSLVATAISRNLVDFMNRTEAEIAAEEEWSKDDYLQALVDRWQGDELNDDLGLKAVFAKHPEDPEAKRVHDELARYEAQVEKIVAPERERLLEDWKDAPLDELIDIATEKLLERRADNVFMQEAEIWQLYYAVRLPENHSKRYFDDVDEVRVLEEPVRTELLMHYALLTVGVTEGKGSEGIPVSSPSSEPSEPEATEVSSGPLVAAR